MSRMAGLAAHDKVEAIGRREAGAARIAEGADLHVGVVVEAERKVDALGRAIRDHRGRAFKNFLRRLEHQKHAAGELRRQVAQHGRNTEQHTGVDVVPAGMHLSC